MESDEKRIEANESENERNEAKASEKKGIGAKNTSLWAQIIAAVWVIGWNAAQFVRTLAAGGTIEQSQILYSGVTIAACFTPVYFNLIMDKIKEIKAA